MVDVYLLVQWWVFCIALIDVLGRLLLVVDYGVGVDGPFLALGGRHWLLDAWTLWRLIINIVNPIIGNGFAGPARNRNSRLPSSTRYGCVLRVCWFLSRAEPVRLLNRRVPRSQFLLRLIWEALRILDLFFMNHLYFKIQIIFCIWAARVSFILISIYGRGKVTKVILIK